MTEILVSDTFRAGLSAFGEVNLAADIYQNAGKSSNLAALSVGEAAQFNNTVTLSRDPVQGLEAVTKRYVDAAGTEAARLASTPVAGSRWFSTDKGRDWMYDGFGWVIVDEDWRDFVPANQGGFTIGGGNLKTQFRRHYAECDVSATFYLGTGSAMGTNPHFDVPFQAWDLTFMEGAGVLCHDFNGANGGRFAGMMFSPTADQGDNDVHWGVLNASGGVIQITATVPFTWAVNDYITAKFTYSMYDRHTAGNGGP